MNAQAEVLPVREIVERLVSYRDGIEGREARELIAEAANRLLIQENELSYAYSVVSFGFEYGSFDFSVLRKRAADFSLTEGAR